MEDRPVVRYNHWKTEVKDVYVLIICVPIEDLSRILLS